MPLYDYRCEQGHTFEVSQPMADDPLEKCDCGAAAERVMHSPAAAVAGASTYGSGYQAKPAAPKAKDAASVPASEKSEEGSWLDSAGHREGPPKTFRRTLRRN